MRESTIEGLLVQGAARAGWLALKFVSPGNAGVPDRILIGPNRQIIFVELKTETGRLTTMQTYQIARLRGFGHDVRVLYGADAVKRFINEICTARLSEKSD